MPSSHGKQRSMISEIDIQDWEHTPPMKLYEAPRDSIISLVDGNDYFNFSHIDGAYSFCKLLNTENVVHLSAFSDIFVWNKKG